METKYRKYVVMMMLCFIFGGFSLVSFFLQSYSTIFYTDIGHVFRGGEDGFNVTAIGENNLSQFNGSRQPQFSVQAPFFSPMSAVLFITGLVSVFAGFSIWNLIREKEIKFTKKTVLDMFLLPEEKIVMEEIEKHGGSLRQNELVRNTGFSKVKIHRVLKNLEKKNLVIKQQYGMTNKIVLKK